MYSSGAGLEGAFRAANIDKLSASESVPSFRPDYKCYAGNGPLVATASVTEKKLVSST
jgi:hypothetical protein